MNRTLTLLFLLAASPAMAHAMLDRADPSAGAELKDAPKQLQLEFSEQLEPAFSSVAVTDAAGHSVAAAKPAISGAIMAVKLNLLPPGQYRVRWHAVSVDTHRTDGGYSFTVTGR